MTDRKTRKAIKAVINKYTGKHTGKMLSAGVIGAGVGIAAMLDLMFTGGITTTVLLASGGVAGGISSLGALALYKTTLKINDAGQHISYNNSFVEMAFDKMQENLNTAFKKAAAPDANRADKAQLLATVQEITADARTLSPVFNILSGKPVDRYEFSVPDGRTLTKALEDMDKPAPQKKEKKTSRKNEGPSVADLKKFQEQMDALDRIAGKKPNNDGPAAP